MPVLYEGQKHRHQVSEQQCPVGSWDFWGKLGWKCEFLRHHAGGEMKAQKWAGARGVVSYGVSATEGHGMISDA